MVRLKVKEAKDSFKAMGMFQFQYGTIKRSLSTLAAFIPVKFQFQYGTIKSKIALVSEGENGMFQFQYGTIKSKLIE